jgi:hypothetical protein
LDTFIVNKQQIGFGKFNLNIPPCLLMRFGRCAQEGNLNVHMRVCPVKGLDSA